VIHHATKRFWKSYDDLPEQVQRVADENFQLLKSDPFHPSLHFKKIGRYWSVRAGLQYRALGVRHEEAGQHTMRQSSKSILRERRLQMQSERRMSIFGWLIVTAFVGFCIWGLHHITGSWIGTGAVFGVLSLICWCASVVRSQGFSALAATRPSESICDFARSFDRHATDTVLIRSVYETVQDQIGGPPVPLRASDRLLEDLDLDDDDLDEIAVDAAALAWRSLDSTDSNPLYGRVTTIQDLVDFLRHQPAHPTMA
jgi:hypothetical protein